MNWLDRLRGKPPKPDVIPPILHLLELELQRLNEHIARIEAKPAGYYVLAGNGQRIPKQDWLEDAYAARTRLEGHIAAVNK